MRGRSPDQLALYEANLAALAAVLRTPMTVRQIRDALAIKKRKPVVATVLERIEALKARGVKVKSRKRRGKIPGKTGQRERVYWVEP